jgi:hypothetical protein
MKERKGKKYSQAIDCEADCRTDQCSTDCGGDDGTSQAAALLQRGHVYVKE